ncbi:hypothetical protein [Cupriavidus sp. EM10]|uniref:hypothetical protein n=1 Tax=Cupriavidus sp. EM10 TaxID=2839983 RepID=UPI001BFFF760|nr:hypothetical protein [Cupriavidus sp. EM10]QWE98367.1 hypothetical protein KLP38_30350 [Cupriavidus sp. EM10]
MLDALCKAPDPAGRPVFLARPFGGGGGALQGAVKRPPIYHVLRTLGLTPVDDNTLAVFFALSHAGRTGTVVTSMFTEAHLRQNLALVSQFEALGERGQQIAPAILHAVCPQDCSLRG